MKKSILFLFLLTALISFNTKAQTTELWGLTYTGGTYDAGVIFKTDANGDNQQTVYNGFKYEGKFPWGSLVQASNGKLYGMTSWGGTYNYGVLFEYDPATNIYTKKFVFDYINGANPHGYLMQAFNGKLYGVTSHGGANDVGVLFEYDIDTDTFTKKIDFDDTNGANPTGSLIQASNGKLYGMTKYGGNEHNGVLFEYDTATDTYIKKYDFNQTNGTDFKGSLMQASNGRLYGMTKLGGANNKGVLFEYDIATDTFTKKYDFNQTNGTDTKGSLIQASNGRLYGMTSGGGAHNKGVLFEYDPAMDTYIKKFDFDDTNGANPYFSLMQASNGKLYGMTYRGGDDDKGVLFEYDLAMDTYIKKIDFDDTNGANPSCSLLQGSNGKLYGTAARGGAYGHGVLFEYDIATDTYTKKFNFGGTYANHARGALMQASNDKLYGMAESGGANDDGVLFEYDPITNSYSNKFDFDGTNGKYPEGALIQASNGKLYGMTFLGGAYDVGILFEYDPATGIYIKKLDFDGVNGASPYGSLMQASSGKLYGMTVYGGAYDVGILFEYDPATGIYIKKFDFDGVNGANSFGHLIQASNGKLYGMTQSGGTNNDGVLFEYDPAAGTYTKKFDFGGTNGKSPYGSLIQTSNGKIYGMTKEGGTNDDGVLFEYDPTTDIYTKKYDFDGTNGKFPKGTLMQATNGKLYGMTFMGGTVDAGVLFEYDIDTDTYTKKFDFDGTNGAYPVASLIEIDASLSIENQANINITISPNPTTNLVKISMTEKPVKVSVVNMAGVLIYETNQTGKEMSIDMSNYANAVYLVKIQTDKGVATYKVIKQ